MGLWQVVTSTQATNFVKNPSFEASTLTNTWTAMSGITASVNSTVSHVLFGLQSIRFEATATNTNGVYGELDGTLASATTYVTFYAKGTEPSSWRIGLGTGTSVPANATTATAISGETLGSWTRYLVTFTGVQASGATRVFIVLPSSGSYTVDAYLDGVQVEQTSVGYTTYLDGSFGEGHEWYGAQNASKSTRYAYYANKPVSGGYVNGLDDTTTLLCTGFSGAGAPGIKVIAQEATVGASGGLYQHTLFPPRSVVLTFTLLGSSYEGLLNNRAAYVLDKIKLDQPFELRYVRGSTVLAMFVVYEGGFEFGAESGNGFVDKFSLSFTAYETPMWRLVYDSFTSLTLQTSTSVAPYYLERKQGVWTVPVSIGMTAAYAAIVAADKSIYVGGVGGSYQFIKITSSSTVTNIAAASGGASTVWALAQSLDGQYIYIGGNFTTLGGTAANYIIRYSISAGTFAALSTGMNGIVYALKVSPYDGKLYAGGAFTTAGGTTVNGFASWDGSAWAAIKGGVSGGNATVYALDIGPNGDIFLGGDFLTAGSISTPGAPTVSGTTGGTFASGTVRYYKLSALTGTSETPLGSSGNHTLSGNTAFSLSWSGVTNATGYNVYRASDSSTNAVYYLIGTTTGTSFVDYGYSNGARIRAAGAGCTVAADVTVGAWPVSTTRYYKTSFVTASGASEVGSSGNATTTSGNQSFRVIATAVPGAVGYDFYRSTASGGTYYYVGSSEAPTSEIYDTGFPDTGRTADDLTTTTGSDSVNLARYDIIDGAYYNIGTVGALGGVVYAIKILDDGVSAIVGGAFAWVDGQACNKVAYYNGSTLVPLGDGVSGGNVRVIGLDADGSVLVGGGFTSAGGLSTAGSLARWVSQDENGAWTHTDLGTFSSTVTVYAIATRYRDTLVFTDGGGGSLTWKTAAQTSITNGGTSNTYPMIALVGPSSGTMTVYGLWVHNVGQLLLNLTIYQSELVIIDLRTVTIVSSIRGPLTGAILAGSAFSSLPFRPGANPVGLLCTGTTTQASATVIDRTSYLSIDT